MDDLYKCIIEVRADGSIFREYWNVKADRRITQQAFAKAKAQGKGTVMHVYVADGVPVHDHEGRLLR